MSSDVKHDYHLVDPSPWPLVGSIGGFTMLLGAVFLMVVAVLRALLRRATTMQQDLEEVI